MIKKFSIVIPVYNTEKYLKKCVDSVLKQTYKNFEVILVDDGSTDRSSVICDEYAENDKRVRVIHKENGGLVSARKAGAKVSKAEYVACLDSDDWIDENYLKEFYNIIEKYNPDVVCGGLAYIYPNEKKYIRAECEEGMYNKERIKEEIFPFLIEDEKGRSFHNCLCGKVIKSKIYNQFQQLVDNNIKMAEDHACLKPIVYNANSIYIMDKFHYYYRQNETSMTKEKRPVNLKNVKYVSKHLIENIKCDEYDFLTQVYRSTVHGLFTSCCSQFYSKEEYKIITQRIKITLSDTFYKEAINKCKFKKFTKFWFAKYVLKYKMYYIMKLYSKFK